MFSVIIAAAGASQRMGGISKQLEKIGDTPVFVMSALKFNCIDEVEEIIITAPESEIARYEKLARNYDVTKLTAVVAGGETRCQSVKNALSAVSEKADFVAIHDGARPLIETDNIRRVLSDAVKYGAAIAATPAVDTIKQAGSNGFIEKTIPRSGLYYAQTPQAFKKKTLLECFEKLGLQAENLTDDSSLAELCGEFVKITEITSPNFKITRPDDLTAARAIFENRKVVKKL